jgi:hypothetical protein
VASAKGGQRFGGAVHRFSNAIKARLKDAFVDFVARVPLVYLGAA